MEMLTWKWITHPPPSSHSVSTDIYWISPGFLIKWIQFHALGFLSSATDYANLFNKRPINLHFKTNTQLNQFAPKSIPPHHPLRVAIWVRVTGNTVFHVCLFVFILLFPAAVMPCDPLSLFVWVVGEFNEVEDGKTKILCFSRGSHLCS